MTKLKSLLKSAGCCFFSFQTPYHKDQKNVDSEGERTIT